MCDDAAIAETIDALETVDARLFKTLGYCVRVGGAIAIDTGFKSLIAAEATLEHELTHRIDFAVTHFGNLYNLLYSAHEVSDHFPSVHCDAIRKMVRRVNSIPNLSSVCLEGRATYNQKRYFPDMSANAWAARLKPLKDQSYHNGFILASQIMAHFPVDDVLDGALSDTLLRLPLYVPWYEGFSSICDAHALVNSLRAEDFPSYRLRLLASCLDTIARDKPQIIREFLAEATLRADGVNREALGAQFTESTSLFDGVAVQYPVVPTGIRMASFLQELITVHLKGPLENLGLRYADYSDVPRVNEIVKSWNRQTLADKTGIPEFRTVTRLDAQLLGISFKPIDHHTGVNPIGSAIELGRKVRDVLRRSPTAYCIARLFHVTAPNGWEMSSTRTLPRGAWYCVFALMFADILGRPGVSVLVRSPETVEKTWFSRFYMCFESCADLLARLPTSVPRILWLMPSSAENNYRDVPLLRRDLDTVTKYMRGNMANESECYTVLIENSVESVLRQAAHFMPSTWLYNDSAALWRLWRTDGPEKVTFVSAKARNIHKEMEGLFEAIGAKCLASDSPHDSYLLQWFGSGEGF